jgi:hypothetical protein
MLASNDRLVQPLMGHYMSLGWLTFVRMGLTIIRLQGRVIHGNSDSAFVECSVGRSLIPEPASAFN